MAFPAVASCLLISLPCLLSVIRPATAGCSNATEFSTQLDTLLAEYDREILPGPRLLVELALHVRHANIDERASSVRVLADLIMKWEDKRLTWNSSDWGCDSALVSAERLWLPDVVVVSAATRGPETEGQRARLSNEGLISWTTPLDLSAPVELHLEAWPRDLQTIEFKFASRDHETDQMDLKLGDSEDTPGFASGGWRLVDVSRDLKSWQRSGVERRLAIWKLSLKRQAPAHALATASLLAAITLLMLAGLALPPADRPALFACASFTAALWLVSALVRLPGSVTAPRSLASAGVLCACGGVAALCAALVVRVASARPSPAPSPALRACLATAAAAASFCRISPEGASNGERGAWASAAKLLDLMVTIILMVVLLVTICVSL